uniref:Uncharacterized protein n=1 Tax=Parascaris equorum TaxID=6256 RepID=A0A914R4P9_PAREQ
MGPSSNIEAPSIHASSVPHSRRADQTWRTILIFLHYPMQQNCCVKVLDQMEWFGWFLSIRRSFYGRNFSKVIYDLSTQYVFSISLFLMSR